MNIIRLSLVAIAVMVSGCAAMSVEECQHANWTQIGEKDGVAGRSSRIASYEKACLKGDIQPNQTLYQIGYQQGLAQYCQPSMIFNASLNGAGNYQVCPVERHSALRPFHDTAITYYQARKAKDELFDELERYQQYLLDRDLSKETREHYRKRLAELRIQQERIEFNYFEADRQLTRFKRQHGL